MFMGVNRSLVKKPVLSYLHLKSELLYEAFRSVGTFSTIIGIVGDK